MCTKNVFVFRPLLEVTQFQVQLINIIGTLIYFKPTRVASKLRNLKWDIRNALTFCNKI